MKKIVQLFIIFIASCILFSCGTLSNPVFIKRHYSNGYFVEKNSNKIILDKNNLPSLTPQIISKNYTTINEGVKNESSDEKLNITNKDMSVVNTKFQSNKNTGNTLKNRKPIFKGIKTNFKKVENVISDKKTLILKPIQERSARSLFWIVVLVLLILWALGFLGGLGSFIHFVLLAALIIFILWLIRII
jgi:hypothetical protein